MSTLTFYADFDDLAVGDSLRTRRRTVTEADVVAFANLTWDHNPIHVDEIYARSTPFGGRIAHGLLLLTFAVGLTGFEGPRVLALRSVDSAVFKRPLRLGETMFCQIEVDALKPVDDESGIVTVAARVRNQDGKLLALGKLSAIWRRGPLPPGADPAEPPAEASE